MVTVMCIILACVLCALMVFASNREFVRRLMLEDSGEAVILTWNVTNWVTIILMVAIGFFVIGLGMKWYQSRQSGS